MSSLATVALRSSRSIARKSAPSAVRHAHSGPNSHMPFNFTTTSKQALGLKFLVFFGTAFSIPFVANYWHWHRPGGINNP
ncbi:hypothetical protein CC1G_02587 [Coprinopsis cinerea okayama7|uniref:Cytochrome c oxidase subunit 8, mitochondrial n=1 Tax=Coprinopsis cinerea (strain Okayama-7 / 130 / ATCC MYA-4618 / FGSC 9003) TaxID=240176 RepID=A8PB89_COPC7|nr:hypothetical protein CC1G_02587 [Coprinopsis cinerea okayama7\|eukprot:XP_001840124.2 hypothetical protein CC1G_02587 [Coprinopsis cinerea okayama7\